MRTQRAAAIRPHVLSPDLRRRRELRVSVRQSIHTGLLPPALRQEVLVAYNVSGTPRNDFVIVDADTTQRWIDDEISLRRDRNRKRPHGSKWITKCATESPGIWLCDPGVTRDLAVLQKAVKGVS